MKAIRPTITAEVRGARREQYSFVDDQTGKTVSGEHIVIQAEASEGNDVLQLQIKSRLPENAGDKFEIPLKRGVVYTVALDSFAITKGQAQARADLQAFIPLKK